MNDFTKNEIYALIKCVRIAEMEYGSCSELDNLLYKLRLLKHSSSTILHEVNCNKPNTKCDLCNAVFYVPSMCNRTAPYITDCRLHMEPNYTCYKCNRQFYIPSTCNVVTDEFVLDCNLHIKPEE